MKELASPRIKAITSFHFITPAAGEAVEASAAEKRAASESSEKGGGGGASRGKEEPEVLLEMGFFNGLAL